MPGPGPLFPWDDDDDDDLQNPESTPEDALRLPGGQPLLDGLARHVTLSLPTLEDDWTSLRFAVQATLIRRYLQAQGCRVNLQAPAARPAWMAPLGLGTWSVAPESEGFAIGLAPAAIPIGPVTPSSDLPATPSEALETWGREPVLLALVDTPAAEPLALTPAHLEAAHDRLLYLYGALQRANDGIDNAGVMPDYGSLLAPLQEAIPTCLVALHASLGGGFDAPAALQALADLARALGDASRGRRKTLPRDIAWSLAAGRAALVQGGAHLGLLQQLPERALPALHTLRTLRRGLTVAQIEALLQRRLDARAARDFTAADALRAELEALGVEIMDGPWGSRWGLSS